MSYPNKQLFAISCFCVIALWGCNKKTENIPDTTAVAPTKASSTPISRIILNHPSNVRFTSFMDSGMIHLEAITTNQCVGFRSITFPAVSNGSPIQVRFADEQPAGGGGSQLNNDTITTNPDGSMMVSPGSLVKHVNFVSVNPLGSQWQVQVTPVNALGVPIGPPLILNPASTSIAIDVLQRYDIVPMAVPVSGSPISLLPCTNVGLDAAGGIIYSGSNGQFTVTYSIDP